MPDHLEEVIKRVVAGSCDEADIQAIATALQSGQLSLVTGNRAAGIAGDASNAIIITGDNNLIVQGQVAESLQAVLERFNRQKAATASVDELVQQVRSRLDNDIQRLHSTMPLWGVDHWVPLGELFVDVNILEELSSSGRSELADLWQDFSQNPSYRSLDRIGLGRERQRVSGLEVLEKHTNLMVVGKPGSGKTTYLQRVVTECNAGNLQAHKIPVLIKLREFVEDGRDIAYSLERYLEQRWQLSATETQLVLNQGRSLVLFDGLDEVTGDDGKSITKQIKRFARAYPQVQMVVTCRTQSFLGEMDWKSLRFSFVEVADFNEPQVRLFAEHWFKTVMQDEATGLVKSHEFLEQLFREENKPIRELAITPILLSLTCAVFQQKQAFYSKRSKLYEEELELLLEQWDKAREIERDEIYRDLSVERKLELLSYLAVKKFEQEQYVLFEQEEIEGYIAKFLGIGQRESRSVLKAIESQHGLLIERSQKIWSFSHLTFQEYFTARWFVVSENWQRLANQIIQKNWHEVSSLVLEITDDPRQLFDLMKDTTDLLLANDQKLQQFLEWISQKSSSLSTRSAYTLRAYYFELILVSEKYFNEINTLPGRYDYPPYSFALVQKINRSIDADDDKYEYRMLSEVASIVSQIEEFTTGETAWQDLCYVIKSVCIQNAQLSNDLKYVKEIVHASKEDVKIRVPEEITLEWWQKHASAWIAKYQARIIKEKNIGHKWQFNDVQKELLQQYYDANCFLAECLNRNLVIYQLNQYLDQKTGCFRYNFDQQENYFRLLDDMEDIKTTLLTPIAEIEKRKREKVE